MKALIYILAIVLIAAGLAVGLVSVFSPGQVVLGLDLHLGGTLLVGGVVTLALAGVISTLSDVRRHFTRLASAAKEPAMGSAASSGAFMEPTAFNKPAEDAKPAGDLAPEVVAGVAAVAVAATASTDDEAPSQAEEAEVAAVATTHEILMRPREEPADKHGTAKQPADEEEAAEAGDKADKAAVAEAAPEADEEAAEPEEPEEAAGEEEVEGGDLYVVEERTIHGRPARLLSDGTVEAETDEGWMRFENLEHLEEYTAATERAQ